LHEKIYSILAEFFSAISAFCLVGMSANVNRYEEGARALLNELDAQ